MLIKEHQKYNAQFPENFEWELIDSYALSELAPLLVDQINKSFHSANRNLVPGLRQALNTIAEIAHIYE